jgi:hypothetical protein
MQPKSWWLAHVAVLRAGAGSAKYDAARTALAAEMARVAKSKAFGGYRARIGDAAAADIARDVVWGAPSKSRKAEDVSVSLGGSTAAQRLATDGWRAGVLDRLEASAKVIEEPFSYFWKAIENRLHDAARVRPPVVDHHEPDSEEQGSGLLEGVASTPPDGPYVIVEDVASNFADAAAYARLALELLPLLSADHPLRALAAPPGAKASPLTREIEGWATSSDLLETDLALRAGRRRWWHGVAPAIDGQARAWQAAYYAYEEQDDHWDPSERPDSLTARTAADAAAKHLQRFRLRFAQARATAGAVVEHAAEGPLRAKSVDGRRAVVAVWTAAEHPTLEQPHKAGGRP